MWPVVVSPGAISEPGAASPVTAAGIRDSGVACLLELGTQVLACRSRRSEQLLAYPARIHARMPSVNHEAIVLEWTIQANL